MTGPFASLEDLEPSQSEPEVIINANNSILRAYIPDDSSDSGGSGGNVTPDTHPASPNAMDDEFEGTSLNVKWSEVNFTGATANVKNGCLNLITDINASSARAPRLITQPISGSAWKIRAKMSMLIGTANVGGIVAFESGSGKILAMGLLSTPEVALFPYPSLTTAPTPFAVVALGSEMRDAVTFESDWRYYEIERSGSNLTFRMSKTGIDGTFTDVGTEAIATYFTTAPDSVGVYGESVSATIATQTVVDWFRRVA